MPKETIEVKTPAVAEITLPATPVEPEVPAMPAETSAPVATPPAPVVAPPTKVMATVKATLRTPEMAKVIGKCVTDYATNPKGENKVKGKVEVSTTGTTLLINCLTPTDAPVVMTYLKRYESVVSVE